jgi:hypothetical protein
LYRTETVQANGQDFELQSVSPRWYYETNQRCNMSSDQGKDVLRYMDTLFKNVVISPAEVTQKGFAYFDEKDDIETPEALIREIERFLRPGKQTRADGGAGAGK